MVYKLAFICSYVSHVVYVFFNHRLAFGDSEKKFFPSISDTCRLCSETAFSELWPFQAQSHFK